MLFRERAAGGSHTQLWDPTKSVQEHEQQRTQQDAPHLSAAAANDNWGHLHDTLRLTTALRLRVKGRGMGTFVCAARTITNVGDQLLPLSLECSSSPSITHRTTLATGAAVAPAVGDVSVCALDTMDLNPFLAPAKNDAMAAFAGLVV